MTPEALAALLVGTIKRLLEQPKERLARLEQHQQTQADQLKRLTDEVLEVRAALAARERELTR